MNAKEVWRTLSQIDCSQHIEKKGNLSYLSWAWAWGTLMDNFPEAEYKIHKERRCSTTGTMECRVTVTVGPVQRTMWLPVMDNRNNAVENPNLRQISDTRMRCLVKCIAMFGLGHYIYAGEDLPHQLPISDEEKSEYMRILGSGDGVAFLKHLDAIGEQRSNELYNIAPQGKKGAHKKQVDDLVKAGNATLDEWAAELAELIEQGDPTVVYQAAELDKFEKVRVWARWSPVVQAAFRALQEEQQGVAA